MNGRADRWIRRTTIGCVAMLALIAGTVSYLHMHLLVELHGQPGWVAALTPLSVDGMIVAASTTLLAESRSGNGGGFLPWALLIVGSAASLAANVAAAEPTLTGRVIAAWPSFSLIAAYELLMRQVRRAAELAVWRQRPAARTEPPERQSHQARNSVAADRDLSTMTNSAECAVPPTRDLGKREAQAEAWRWATSNRNEDGSLPAGKEIAVRFGRHERWGRLVKQAGLAGELGAKRESTSTT